MHTEHESPTPGLDLTAMPTGPGTVLVAGGGGLIGSDAARQQMNLAGAMPSPAGVWARLVVRHSWVDTPFEKLTGWGVGDFLFHHEADNPSPLTSRSLSRPRRWS